MDDDLEAAHIMVPRVLRTPDNKPQENTNHSCPSNVSLGMTSRV